MGGARRRAAPRPDEKQFENGDPPRDGNRVVPAQTGRSKASKISKREENETEAAENPQAEPSGATTLDGGEEGDANSPEAVEDRHPPARERRAAGDHDEDEERRRRRRPPGPRQGRARLCHVPPLEHRSPSQTACVRARREKGREVREARRMEAAEEGGRWRRRGGRALSAAPIYTTSAAAPASSPRPAVPALPLQIAGFATRSPGPRAEGPGRKYGKYREGCTVPVPSKICSRAN